MCDGIQPPAGGRRAGGRLVGFRAKRQGSDAAFFRGKLQAPAISERYVAQFADDGGNLTAAQALFHGPQRVAVAPGSHQDQPGGVDPELQQGRAIKSAGIQRPGAFAP